MAEAAAIPPGGKASPPRGPAKKVAEAEAVAVTLSATIGTTSHDGGATVRLSAMHSAIATHYPAA